MFRTAARRAALLVGRSRTLATSARVASQARLSSTAVLAGAGAAAAAVAYQMSTPAECAWYSFIFGGNSSALPSEWEQVRKEIEEIIAANTSGPMMVRLAWHLAGTWDAVRKNGGSNGGTMRFAPESNYGANAGLAIARDQLEAVKQKHPSFSYADIYTFAGKVAVEYMGGPTIPWKPGRTDDSDGSRCTEDGRLPDASKGSNHIRDIFYRMGFNDREIVALLGAHTLGECHKDRSGYVGPWTRDPNGFDNSYFTLLLDEKWTLSKKHADPPQFEDSTGELMMLPADMALLVDTSFRKYVDLYAKDSAAWEKDFATAFGKLLENGVKRS